MGRGEAPIPEQETVASYLQRWLEDKKAEVRPRTYESYEQIVRNHLAPGLGRFRLASWDRATLQRGCDVRRRKG